MNGNTRPQSTKGLVLVVEDSPTQALRTHIVLDQAGFSVQVCANAAGALAFLAQRQPDLILLDMHLPDLSGQEIATRLKADPALSGIPIVFLTGAYLDSADIASGLELGADDYLTKPMDDVVLVARVHAVLRATQTQRKLGRMVRGLLVTFNEVGSRLAGVLDRQELLTSFVDLICANFEFPSAQIFLLEADELVLAAAGGQAAAAIMTAPPRLLLAGDSLVAACFRETSLQIFQPRAVELEIGINGFSPGRQLFAGSLSGAAALVRSAGWPRGVLEILSPASEAFTNEDYLILQTLADLIGVALHNSQLYEDMTALATIDSLTGLLNRRMVLQRLDVEWARCARYERSLALISLDVDRFKTINDQYGHATGDRVLRAVAGCIEQGLRQTDLAGRLGGDEFVLVLPETEQSGALIVAERLRSACAQLAVRSETAGLIHPGVSIGVAAWPETKAARVPELLQAADAALYRAKTAGRNQVAQ